MSYTTNITVNVRHYACLTAANGPVVLLLHGFPDLAISRTAQIAALSAAGDRAIAGSIGHQTSEPDLASEFCLGIGSP